MEIPHTRADLSQVLRGHDGRMVQVESDVQGVVNSLHAVDPHIHVRYSYAGEYFVIYHRPPEEPEGNGYVITTAKDLDPRVVKTVERIYWNVRNDPDYSLAQEMEKLDAKADAAKESAASEHIAEIGEQLAHAIRKDQGVKDRIRVPNQA